MRTHVFEVLPAIQTVISCQQGDPPTDPEWDEYVEAVRSAHTGGVGLNLLAVTGGGRPSPAQQARLAAVLSERPRVLAVVSASAGPRFVVSAMRLVNARIACFEPDRLGEALRFVGIAPSGHPAAMAAIERLRRALAEPVLATAGAGEPDAATPAGRADRAATR